MDYDLFWHVLSLWLSTFLSILPLMLVVVILCLPIIALLIWLKVVQLGYKNKSARPNEER